jgi:hypothetical protein
MMGMLPRSLVANLRPALSSPRLIVSAFSRRQLDIEKGALKGIDSRTDALPDVAENANSQESIPGKSIPDGSWRVGSKIRVPLT